MALIKEKNMCLDLDYWNFDDEDYAKSLPSDNSQDLKDHVAKRKAKQGGHVPIQTEVEIEVKVRAEGVVTDFIQRKCWVPADKQDELYSALSEAVEAAIKKTYQ
jgi:hypothetical protein